MYEVPEMFDTQDYLCDVDPECVEACKDICKSKDLSPCIDEDIFDLCVGTMTELDLDVPMDSDEALVLYKTIRPVIRNTLGI